MCFSSYDRLQRMIEISPKEESRDILHQYALWMLERQRTELFRKYVPPQKQAEFEARLEQVEDELIRVLVDTPAGEKLKSQSCCCIS
jgi:hypothetical protein